MDVKYHFTIFFYLFFWVFSMYISFGNKTTVTSK
uniref:Uncharacterized protein n=1 Tax=Rhizophora mucronata TaxID=61149 RepID=A0A2P2NXM5_RHIMU